MTRPLFNECPCGAAMSIPMGHPHRDEIAGRWSDEHRQHRAEAAKRLLDEKSED